MKHQWQPRTKTSWSRISKDGSPTHVVAKVGLDGQFYVSRHTDRDSIRMVANSRQEAIEWIENDLRGSNV